MSEHQLLDPTNESTPPSHGRAARLPSLAGRTVGLLDISKPRGDVFLGVLREHLERRGAEILEFRKPTFTKVAPLDLRREIAARCSAVVEALAD